MSERGARAHVHGFHSYPARLHPTTARTLIQGFSDSSSHVLDPFCGSGTVAVEARLLDRAATVSDVNPLALELTWLKTLAKERAWLEQLVLAAKQVHAFAEERRQRRAGPITRYNARIRDAFPVHVLLELDSLSHGISGHTTGDAARALTLVLSSLMTKVSHRESDSSGRRVERRLKSGFTTEAFLAKAVELGKRLGTYSRQARLHAAPRILAQDARQLRRVANASVDLVVSSPPYPGVFDYLDHHRLRFDFFDTDPKRLAAREVGARRHFRGGDRKAPLERWREELLPCLLELERVLRPGRYAALVVGDSAVGSEALRADEYLRTWAADAGLAFAACASQRRQSFHEKSRRAFRTRARAEHLVLLRKRG